MKPHKKYPAFELLLSGIIIIINLLLLLLQLVTQYVMQSKIN